MKQPKQRSSLVRFVKFGFVVLFLGVLADTAGLPHLRVTWTSNTNRQLVYHADYWSVTGRRTIQGPLPRSAVPLVKIMQPEPRVHARAARWFDRLRAAQETITNGP